MSERASESSGLRGLPGPATLAASFGMSDDQDDLRAATRAVLERYAPLSVRARTGEEPAGEVWAALTGLGLPGMLVPERWGGAGLGPADAAVVLEESGRVLLPAPLLSTTLAVATVLAHADPDQAALLLPRVAAGELVVTVAVAEAGGWSAAAPATTAVRRAEGWSVTGSKMLVLDGAQATTMIVAASTGTGTGLFLVDSSDAGVTATPTPTLDVTRRFARVAFAAAPARQLGREFGEHLVADVLDLAVVLLGAEQVGATRRALEIAVEHARTRVQYGRAIGSFQAVKHRLADMLIDVEYAGSIAAYAAWAVSDGPDELPVLAGTLKTTVAEASVRGAEGLIQVLGGTGFTWEHVAHLFYKRALSDRLLFGSVEDLQDRSARLLGF